MKRKLTSVLGNSQRLDGGSMFGNAPRAVWERWIAPDDRHRIPLACRCLLIEEADGRRVLLETGIGAFFAPKMRDRFGVQEDEHVLLQQLDGLGLSHSDIDVVVLSHLHFDHVGGAIQWNKDHTGYEPAFKNAKFWTNENHWQWATQPNVREKASFLKENLIPMQESGQLKFIDRAGDFSKGIIPEMEIFFADGHTESQMIPILNYQGKRVAFMADLLPSVGHIPLPYVMGYDTRPLLTLSEKNKFLNKAAEEQIVLFLEHDFDNECCTLKKTEKGVRLNEAFSFSTLFN